MKLKRFTTQLVAAGLIAVPLMANAAGLGKLSVTSALGQPLTAEIELFAADKAELDSLSATIASDQAFRDARVEFSRCCLPCALRSRKARWQGGAESYLQPSGQRSLHRHAGRTELGLGTAGARIHHAARSAWCGCPANRGSGSCCGAGPGPAAKPAPAPVAAPTPQAQATPAPAAPKAQAPAAARKPASGPARRLPCLIR